MIRQYSVKLQSIHARRNVIRLILLLLSCAMAVNCIGQQNKGRQNRLPAPSQMQGLTQHSLQLPSWIQLNGDTSATISKYFLLLDTARLFQSHHLHPTSDTLPYLLLLKDTSRNYRNSLSGHCWRSGKEIHWRLHDSIKINYAWWRIPAGYELVSAEGNILVKAVSLNKDSSVITVYSNPGSLKNSLRFAFQQVDIRDPAALFNLDSTLLSGNLNGTLDVGNITSKMPSLAGKAAITGWSILQQPPGTLLFEAKSVNDSVINTFLTHRSPGNEIDLSGDFFSTGTRGNVNGMLNIKRMEASLLNALIKNKVNLPRGKISGQLAITGSPFKPVWKGQLQMDSTIFQLRQSGASYAIHQQVILLDYPMVHFKQFTITDTPGNNLKVNGSMTKTAGRVFDLNLNLQADDFTAVNTSRAINNQVYGYAGAGAKMVITGNTRQPVVKGGLRLNSNSNLTLVLPGKNTDREAATAVVRFIEAGKFNFTPNAVKSQAKVPFADTSGYINRAFSIQADPSTTLRIILDATNGDELVLNGKGNFNTGIAPDGQALLSGNYLLDSGYYGLNYQYLKKRFNILPGSAIRFNGYPADALLNIKATYYINSAPINLLGNEVGVVDQATAKGLKENMPFVVQLNLVGTLKEPLISFDIQLADEATASGSIKNTILNKLLLLKGDVAATNKQVFALLVMERFVGEQSTDFFRGNGNATRFSDIAKVSVSQFLSAALDEIASDLFKGINVDLNLNSYQDFIENEGIQKTELGIGLTKSFLNDRLSVTVGRTYGIESEDGSARAARQKGTRFLPYVTVNYKLSANGKYMLRSYRKDPFEVIVDGYIMETGLGFIMTMDYEKYRELLNNNQPKAGR